MSSFARSTYQPQLGQRHLHGCEHSKQHVLAKYWIESILGHRIPSNNLYVCLRDGFYLCKIIHSIQNLPTQDTHQLPEDRIKLFLKLAQEFGLQSYDLFSVNDLMNGEDMDAVVSTILVLAHTYSSKRFAGKSSNLTPLPKRSQSYTFDLVNASTSAKTIPSSPQRQITKEDMKRSKSETLIFNNNNSSSIKYNYSMEQGSNRDKSEREEEQMLEEENDNNNVTAAIVDNEKEEENNNSSPHTKWDPPFDIQRPNCVPAYGPYSIDKFINEEDEDEEENALSTPSPVNYANEEEEEEGMYNTKKSNTPSSSGDSGYGTTAMRSSSTTTSTNNNNNNKVQDLFEALFAPVAPPPATKPPPSLKIKSTKTVSHGNTITSSKLSLLFTKKKEPHYVKFQTWSSHHHHQSSATITNLSTTLSKKKSNHASPHEENLFRSPQPTITEQEWKHRPDAAPPLMIKVEKEHPKPPPHRQPHQQQRGRRRTDASLALPPPEIITTPKPQHSRCKSTGSSLDFINKATAATTAMDDNILDQYEEGNLIARYRLGNVIGKGHFGTVYRALDLMSGKTVAVKQINLKDSKKSDIEDMMQEAQLLHSLTHPNIVKYEGFIQTQHHMNIVLEFVENGSLLNTLKSFGNALPEHLVASYCRHILEGLAYLHERDVVHCDLKAANILTTKAGHVKLSDFGVSLNLKLKSHEDDNLVSGTPFWMSPEVIELKGASVQSDIWSLGCTVIELYTGKPPYADLITMTAMFKIVEDECPPLPSGISDNFQNFLKLCFKKNPHERPTAQMLLHHPWVTASPSTSSSTITKHVRKSNSTILNHYLQKTIEKDDTIVLGNYSPSSPYYTSPIHSQQQHPLSPSHLKQPSPPPHSDLPTFQTKSISSFANKFNKRSTNLNAVGLTARQSMPAIVLNKQQTHDIPLTPHVHNLIDCSFPKGAGQCKVCQNEIKHNALVCKDFCGYICHKQCKVAANNFGRRRASDGPKPVSSVSSQLREKFSFTRKSSKDLSHISEHPPPPPKVKSSSNTTTSWWKKKP